MATGGNSARVWRAILPDKKHRAGENLFAVHNLCTSFDAARDTAGSLQVRFIECEGDRLKFQASLQSCSTNETLKLDDGHDTEYRRASARNE